MWVNDAANIWPTLRIATSIPLGRLEWQWTSQGNLHRDTSTSARAFFQLFSSATAHSSFKNPHEWFLNPYVRIFVVSLPQLEKNGDSTVWTKIRIFVDGCRERMDEFIIILAASDEHVARHKKTVDKLRAEANVSARGRERFVNVPPAVIIEEQRPITHLHHSTVHRDLLIRLRECVRVSVQIRLQAYEDEISRSFVNRTNQSWSFGKHFVLKEGLAFVLLHLGRRDLSVKHYNELYDVLTKSGLRWRGRFAQFPAAETAAGVSNAEARDYRAMLLDGSISEIDIYTYIFARQMNLLLVERKFTLIAEKGVKLISTVARRCAEEASSTSTERPPVTSVFRDIWVFCVSIIICSAMAPAVPSPRQAAHSMQTPSRQLSTMNERHTVRLVAGFHVHALKALQGLANIVLPGCLTPDSGNVQNHEELAREAMSTTNEKLRLALSDRSAAETMHSEISNAAASLYEMGARQRGAAALDGDSGRVHLRNQSYSEAETLLSALCARFTNDSGWDILHRRQRIDLAEAEKGLERTQEYLVSCLTMLYLGRKSRLIDPLSSYSDEEVEDMRQDSEHWVQEAANAARNLPRMMRYKAERLFHISVLPNEEMWEDGSAAQATVRIKSDILSSLMADYVLLECRCIDMVVPKKSALHNADKSPRANAEGMSKSSSTMTTGSQSSSSVENPDAVILRSSDGVVIESGTNNVVVSADEVPHYGRYRVHAVSIFQANLKFLLSGSRSAANISAALHMHGDRKTAYQSASATSMSEVGVFEAQFPFFFAALRPPSVSFDMATKGPFYLIPGSTQSALVRIKAAERGVAESAVLKCSILGPDKNPMTGVSRFLQFGVSSGDVSSELDDGHTLQRLATEENGACDQGKVIISRQIQHGETVDVSLVLQVLEDIQQLRERGADSELELRKCVLKLELCWKELTPFSEREFNASQEATLRFVSPLEVNARVELNTEWGHENVSRAVGLDGTPLGDGGTLVCTITGRTRDVDSLGVRKVSLITPEWLELRPDEAPAHEDLLPCELQAGAEFVCAFDVFLRDESEMQGYAQTVTDGEENITFGQDKLSRRMSWKDMVRPEMEESSETLSIGLNRLEMPRSGRELSLVSRASSEVVEITLGDGPSSEVPDSSKDMSDDKISSKDGMVTGVDLSGREAKDVVDLSSTADLTASLEGGGHLNGDKGEEESSSDATSMATLVLEVEVGGVIGWRRIERKVSMNALRVSDRRYGIERKLAKVAEVGHALELEFYVWEIGARSSGEESEALQYEVDADPSVWMVIGRQRGKINVRGGTVGAFARTTVMPILSGRHAVPSIRLFEGDGRVIALSRYENMNEYMQAVILPSRTVVSVCEARRAENDGDMSDMAETDAGFELEADLDREDGEQDDMDPVADSLPVVIASDSFFAS